MFYSTNQINIYSTKLEPYYSEPNISEDIFEPIGISKPSFTEVEIKSIAEKISDKLIKLVENQLQETEK